MAVVMSTSATSTNQNAVLKAALARIYLENNQLQKCIEENNLMDALKHTSNLLSEFRTNDIGPKSYYELYVKGFSALSKLAEFIKDTPDVESNFLDDLYKLVQYASNIIPRLYLLFTVGVVYIAADNAPIIYLLRDMSEMARGVQNPIRGLFLREYLASQVKDSLCKKALIKNPELMSEYVNFLLHNFTEMNKLWVRYQYQGPSKEASKRDSERREIKTLVGMNLVRISDIENIGVEQYRDEIFPKIIEQIVKCKDVLAQEYLMEVMIETFSEDFTFVTLGQFMDAVAQFTEQTQSRPIVSALIERMVKFAEREAGNRSLLDNFTKSIESLSMKIDENVKTEITTDNTIVTLVQVFWLRVQKILKIRTELVFADKIALLISMLRFVKSCCANNIDLLESIFAFAKSEYIKSQNNIETVLIQLFKLPLSDFDSMRLLFDVPSYQSLLLQSSRKVRVTLAEHIVRLLDDNNCIINNIQELTRLLSFVDVLINSTKQVVNQDEYSYEYGMMARIFHCFQSDDVDEYLTMLKTCEGKLSKGRSSYRYVAPTLVSKALDLALDIRKNKGDLLHIFRFVDEICNNLSKCKGVPLIAVQMSVQTAIVADQCKQDEIEIEFFSKAFQFYEDYITKSQTQYIALNLISGALWMSRALEKDKYEMFCTKFTQFCMTLLKKSDQVRMLCVASHLRWQEKILDEDNLLHCESEKVLTCLQNALKIADSCLDRSMSLELTIELLNQFAYYYERKIDVIHAKYLCGIVEIIQEGFEIVEGSTSEENINLQKQTNDMHNHFSKTLIFMQKKAKSDSRWMECLIS